MSVERAIVECLWVAAVRAARRKMDRPFWLVVRDLEDELDERFVVDHAAERPMRWHRARLPS